MTISFDKKWFSEILKTENAKLNIICFPFGGGNASAFFFMKTLDLPVNIYALRLPGRESRYLESPIKQSADLIDKLINLIPIINLPLVFYGHSMGAGLAFQVAVELQKRQQSLPKLVIASGREPPHYLPGNPTINLSDNELIDYLEKLGGVPGEIPKDSEFLQQYIPKIRADYELNSSILAKKPEPMPFSICIMNGENDKLINAKLLLEWKLHTQHLFSSIKFAGDHFFMYANKDSFMNEVKRQIEKVFTF